MSPIVPKERYIRLCKQYGPGRLPGADRPARGAGYAFATAALVAALSFNLFLGAVLLYGYDSGPLVVTVWDGLGVVSGLLAIPLVVPSAFAVATIVWTLFSHRGRFTDAFNGVVVALGTYLLSGVGLVLAAVPMWVVTGTAEWVSGAVFVVVAGFVLTCWLTLPLGALSGYLHHQARTA